MSSESTVRRHFPSRIADLGFSVELPESWQPQELPDAVPDFDDTTQLFGLAAAVPPYAALVFAAAARPAYADGTLLDWARWLIEQHGVDLRALGAGRLGELPAIVGQCAVSADLGEMVTHFAFAEDGQRLLHVSVTGPAVLGSSVWQAWNGVLHSFALEAPRGPTVALMPPVEPPPADAQVGPPVIVLPPDDDVAPAVPPRDDTQADTAPAQPGWARRAQALEAEDRLEEAEQAMLQGCDQLGVLISIAHLYRERLLRLLAQGDREGAARARERAEHWAWAYASGATSGGEGAALSRERDAFISGLPTV